MYLTQYQFVEKQKTQVICTLRDSTFVSDYQFSELFDWQPALTINIMEIVLDELKAGKWDNLFTKCSVHGSNYVKELVSHIELNRKLN